jgi:hypothetical protein
MRREAAPANSRPVPVNLRYRSDFSPTLLSGCNPTYASARWWTMNASVIGAVCSVK